MGPLINMQKSVFLPLWDNYELYGHKLLHIETFSAIESENLVKISKFFVWKEYACSVSESDKLRKCNILQLNEAVGIFHALSSIPDLSKINGPCQFSLFLEKYTSLIFSHLHKLA